MCSLKNVGFFFFLGRGGVVVCNAPCAALTLRHFSQSPFQAVKCRLVFRPVPCATVAALCFCFCSGELCNVAKT